MEGTIINLTRYCTDDGPGIRTTVFLKGCPLRCAWCHNPESQNPEPEYYVNGEIIGRNAGSEIIVAEVLRDRVYYEASGGGVTVSGGEPMFQPEFTAEILRACRENGIHTAIETSGFASEAALETALKHCDLVLFDLKETDPAKHFQYTGVPLEPILENLHQMDARGIPFWLRLPIIPGWNDRKEHLDRIRAIAESMRHCEKLQIMPYHLLGKYKYAKLGREYRCTNAAEPTKEQKAAWEALLQG